MSYLNTLNFQRIVLSFVHSTGSLDVAPNANTCTYTYTQNFITCLYAKPK